MKTQINQTGFIKTTIIRAGLLVALAAVLFSCNQEELFTHYKKTCHGNKGGDTSGVRDDDRKDQGGSSRDTIGDDDTCISYYESAVDDLDLTNGQTFNSNQKVSLKVTSTGSNGCARSLRFSEKRSVTGSVVDIYLTVEILYEGCICTEALQTVEGNYEVVRESGSGTLEYRIHYTDAQTQSTKVKYFYY
jgi:hypothetical protein